MDCTQKSITVSQLLQQIVATANAGGESAIRLLNVADTGNPYYGETNKFISIEELIRQLIALDGNGRMAIRVALGTDDDSVDLVSCATKYTDGELLMACIGDGTDSLPVLRITMLP